MRGRVRRWLAQVLLRAGGRSAALLLLALLFGALAYRLTASDGADAVARPPGPEAASELTADRTPLLEGRRLRSRPDAEPEAVARMAPPAPEIHTLAQTLSVAAAPPPELAPGDRLLVTLSFYYCEYSEGTPRGDGGGFCGVTRDGSIVYPGAAACDISYLGQLFRIDGDPAERIYRCADTGSAVGGTHRDIWFQSSAEGWSWQRYVGDRAQIEILP